MPFAHTLLSDVELSSSAVTLAAIIPCCAVLQRGKVYTLAVRLIFRQQNNFEFDGRVWGVPHILRCHLHVYSGKYGICLVYYCNAVTVHEMNKVKISSAVISRLGSR